MNKVLITGRATRDTEFRVAGGVSFATIGLVSNRRYNNKNGDTVEEACFIDVKLSGRTAEVARDFVKKGKEVLIEGRLNLESWQGKDGSRQSKHSIACERLELLGGKEKTETHEPSYDEIPF